MKTARKTGHLRGRVVGGVRAELHGEEVELLGGGGCAEAQAAQRQAHHVVGRHGRRGEQREVGGVRAHPARVHPHRALRTRALSVNVYVNIGYSMIKQ